MITSLQAIILGALQGISELFPISSLGHSVIFPSLVGWHINQKDPNFLTFLIFTHFATALVLFFFFLKDWTGIVRGIVRSLRAREISEKDTDAKLGWLLIAGTIPAGILGLLFEEQFKVFFADPRLVSLFLFANGLLLLFFEMLRRRKTIDGARTSSDARIAKLTFSQALLIGAAQTIALFPGFSRTGASLGGGLLVGLTHEDAVRFSFLLATPVIGAAAFLKITELASAPQPGLLFPFALGTIAAGISAFFAVRFLTKYFKTNTLLPFGIYCLIAGIVSSGIFLFR